MTKVSKFTNIQIHKHLYISHKLKNKTRYGRFIVSDGSTCNVSNNSTNTVLVRLTMDHHYFF